MDVYSRSKCELCGAEYRLLDKVMIRVRVDAAHSPLLCFICFRKLLKLKLVEQQACEIENPKRIVEI